MTAASGFVPAHLDVVAPGAAPTRTALVVHGILGSASNWRGFVRRLVEDPRAAAYRWVLVDLRGHGESTLAGSPGAGPAPEPPHTLAACADDLLRLEAHLGVRFDKAYGHSFGGKVVLELAQRATTLREVWFLDTPLGPTPPGSAAREEIARVIAALRALGEPLPGRAEVAVALRRAGLSEGLAQWMTTNVRGSTADGYRWKFDLDCIEALLADYFARDLSDFVRATSAATAAGGDGLRIRAVRGGRSDRFGPAEIAVLDGIAGLEVEVLPDAGHWLHVDDPEGLRALMSRS
ncbi:MAG: alpha/beta fold hydrolase [Myxococcota bacterium]